MLRTLLLSSLIVSAAPETSDLDVYEAAKARIKRDPDAHVRLAVWCETRGLDAYRVKHLVLAVLINPRHATARGLLGLMEYRGKWQRPDEVAGKIASDEALAATLAEYNGKRAALKNTADEHWKLALWCEEKGLKAESAAHLTTVTRLDPKREAAWKRLGYQKHNGRWMTASDIVAEKADAEAQKRADHHWKPKLEILRARLNDRSAARREEAEHALLEVRDPREVNAIWALFVADQSPRAAMAVKILGQIDAPASSRALAMLAAFSSQSEVRRTARETLRNRDPREFVGELLRLVRRPIRYSTERVRFADGKVHPVLYIEGKRTDYVAIFLADAMPLDPGPVPLFGAAGGWLNGPVTYYGADSAELFRSMLANPSHAAATLAQHGQVHGNAVSGPQVQGAMPGYSAADLLVLNATRMVELQDLQSAQAAALNSQYGSFGLAPKYPEVVAMLEENNRYAEAVTPKVSDALNQISGQDLPPDTDEWQRWWANVQGYTYTPPSDKPRTTVVLYSFPSCFGKGTMVKTMSGQVPIEAIKVGDQVLAQDVTTGALNFEVVTVIHHNPPGETLRIRLKDEEILPTVHHSFWRASEGWVRARDLKPGDRIRTLAGLARIEAIESAGIQPVFNLDVRTLHSFFVGRSGALVHDNSLPPLRIEPFDAALHPTAENH